MIKKLLMFVLPLAFAVTSCSKDDEPNSGNPNSGNLAGSKWQVVSDDHPDGGIYPGTIFEFKKGGTCVATDDEGYLLDKMEWSMKGDKLKIFFEGNEEDESDEYAEGKFSITGDKATYTLTWYYWEKGEWIKSEDYSHTITLKKK